MRETASLLGAGLLALFTAVGMVGGPGFVPDTDTVRALVVWRQQQPSLTLATVWLTHLGGSAFLLPMALLAAAWLLWLRRLPQALWFSATVFGGRAGIELLKWLIDRPRPSFEVHPVSTASQAFPSGHAGNSMITYLALALFLLPPRWRGAGVAAALLLSMAVGVTRPVLGVHWPTDVLGGWLFGVVWTFGCWALAQRLRTA